MHNWLLQNLSDVLNREQQHLNKGRNIAASAQEQAVLSSENLTSSSQKYRQAALNAQRDWRSAIAAVEELLDLVVEDVRALDRHRHPIGRREAAERLGEFGHRLGPRGGEEEGLHLLG